MRTALTVLLFVLITNWTFQAFLSYGKSYCSILNWDADTLGFKFGCVASEMTREFLSKIEDGDE